MKSLSNFYLSLLLITPLGLTAQVAHTIDHLVPHEHVLPAQDQADLYNALLRRVLMQLDAIELTLEELALSVATTIKLEDKKPITQHISTLRTFIAQVRTQHIFTFNEKNLEMLVEINKSLIAHINDMLKKKLVSFVPFSELTLTDGTNVANSQALRTRSQLISEPHFDIVTLTVMHNEQLLKSVVDQHKIAGSNAFNRFVKDSEHLAKSKGVTTALLRALPYGLMFTYYIYLVNKDELPAVLKPFKSFIGGMPKGPEKPVLASDSRIDKRYGYEAQHGLLGTPFYALRQLVDVKAEPIFTLGLGGYFMNNIKTDAKDLYGWTSEQGKKLLAYAKGESYEDPSPLKTSKLAFKDIVGFESAKQGLNNLVTYFKFKNEFDRMGTHTDRGYLFVGPLDIGKNLAHAVAGEITSELKKLNGPKARCGVYEIHASTLLKKELGDVIKDVEGLAGLEPAVLIIDNIDWITDHVLSEKVWADLVSTMSSALRGTKKQIIIIGTTHDSTKLEAPLKNLGRLGTVIHFNTPQASERKAYLIKELTKRSAHTESFDLDRLTLLTQGCSYDMLSTVLRHAFAAAHAQKQTLKQQHLENSIDTLVYHISQQQGYQSTAQQDTIAAHIAGQALAHLLLQPNATLLKATILPINTKTGDRKLGCLITRTDDTQSRFTTNRDIDTTCIIDFAGIEAQYFLLNGAVSQQSLQLTNSVTYQLAKQRVFAGIPDTKGMSKEVKERMLSDVWELLHSYQDKAQKLVLAHKDQLIRIKDLLNAQYTVSAEQLRAILG